MQPGETITPGNTPQPPVQKPVQQWQFSADEVPSPPAEPAETMSPLTDNGHDVSWTASEYVAHQKSMSWYVMLGLVTAVLTAIVFLVTQDTISTAVTALGVVMFGVFAARSPHVLTYQLSTHGIMAGQKFYAYSDFKSFSIQENGGINSILFTSMKRFMPGLTLYYPPDQEEKIVNFLADYLPHEERAVDPLDRLMRKVRF